MRSKLTRRISVARSASGDGLLPSDSSLANMKASMAFIAHDAFFTLGREGLRGRLKAQCLRFVRCLSFSPACCVSIGASDQRAP